MTALKFGTTWEHWSREVIDILITKLEISNGDAQGIFEAQEKMAIQIWHASYTPEQAATAIDAASLGGRS